jgi:hypothetical protein
MKHLKSRTNRKNRKRKKEKARRHKKTEQRCETKARQRANGTINWSGWIAKQSRQAHPGSTYASLLSGDLLSKITSPFKKRMAQGNEKVMEEDDGYFIESDGKVREGD